MKNVYQIIYVENQENKDKIKSNMKLLLLLNKKEIYNFNKIFLIKICLTSFKIK